MAFDAYFPHITLPKGKTDYRMGDGIAMICAGQVMLVDGFQGGQPTDGLRSWLAANGVKNIDIAVLTHPHWDHYNGLLQIEEDSRFHIKLVYMYDPLTLKHGCDGSANGRSVKEDMNNAYKWIRAMQAHGTRVLWIDKGSTIKFGDIAWKIFREQPTRFTEEDQGNGWAFVNNGSLCLYSPETELILPGDGPEDQERMMDYFGGEVSGTDVTHHMGSWTQHNARALKRRGCVVAFGSCVEKNGPGTSGWTQYGGRRIKEEGIPLWGQEADIHIHAENGLITFRQGSKTISKKVPYQGKGGKTVGRWVNDKGWKYQNADGSWAHGWAQLSWSKGKDWFYFDDNGYCVYGWHFLKWSKGSNWFYFDPKSAAMRTGWHKLPWSKGENWFYFDGNGAMQTGWKWLTKDGKTGWYYLEGSGAMHIGWIFDEGAWYYLGADGKMVTGWVTYKGKRCYLEPLSDKTHVQGTCYVDRTAVIDGKSYKFDKNGYAEEITVSGAGNITQVSGKLNDISASRRQFVINIANYVRKYAPQYGIKVYSPIIAQAIHESGWGESKLSARYHNYFGLKCGTKWTGKSVNMKTQEEYSAGSLSTISANFRAYDSMEEGVKGYFEFIQLPRYANLKGVTSPRQYLQNIKDDGYATGSQYVDHVMSTLNMYSLTQFDGGLPVAKTAPQGQREAIVSEAISHIGIKEGTVLHHKIIDRYNSRKPLPRGYAVKYTDPWCATFISYLAIVMGYTDIIPVECGCPQMITLSQQMGIWVEDDSYVPKPGDIVLYDWQDSGSGDNTGTADHIGMVEKVVGNTETVIEGNYQDSVKRRELAVNGRYIRGYIVPRYK